MNFLSLRTAADGNNNNNNSNDDHNNRQKLWMIQQLQQHHRCGWYIGMQYDVDSRSEDIGSRGE